MLDFSNHLTLKRNLGSLSTWNIIHNPLPFFKLDITLLSISQSIYYKQYNKKNKIHFLQNIYYKTDF